MNLKKLKIDKDYNRLINILLAIYVTLCLIFALLYNGFFIQPKAFSDGFSYSISETVTDQGDIVGQKTTTFTSNGRTRAIFCSDPELQEIIDNMVASEYGQGMGATCILVRKPEQGMGGTITRTSTGGGVNAQKFYFVDDSHPTLLAYFQKYNINLNYEDRSGVVELYLNGVNSSFPDQLISSKLLDDVEYVNNGDDLRKYINEDNDNVVKNGNPYNPKTVVSSNIPTPQKVTILENGENPCVVWDNPKDVKKFGDKINIEIGFKPTFKLYYGLHFADTVACTDYIGAWLGKLGTHNGFCVLKNSGATTSNTLNGYDMIYDDNYIYDIDPNTDYEKSYIKFAIDQTGKTNLVPFGVGQPPTMSKKIMKGNKQVVGGGDDLPTSIWDTLAPEVLSEIKGLFNGGTVGTSDFRIRYTVNDGDKILVSPWVIAKRNFDNNNNATDDTDISFTDKDDNPIQNPTYLPSSSTNVAQPTMVSSDAWWLNFNGYTANLFTNIGQQMSEWTNDSGGFLGFFAELFNEFPFLSWLLLFSMTLALFLRIFGR